MRRFLSRVKQKLQNRFGKKQQQRKDSKVDDSGTTTTSANQKDVATPAQSPDAPQAQVPLHVGKATSAAAAAGTTLPIALVNRTSSSNVYAFVTGLTIGNNQWFLLQSDGSTGYYPASPSATGAPLGANCAIQLGPPGSSRTVSIPQLAGGRIFFSIGSPLTFFLNPGPALVEPSVTNPSDPNINIRWGFAEFTYSSQLYANITYVDFVSIPLSLTLTNTSGATQTVTGLRSAGLDTICSNLQAQSNVDGVAGWKNLVITYNGTNLRALSPNSDLTVRTGDFANYWEPYVNQVWQRYTSQPYTVHVASIDATGTVGSNGQLTLSGESFTKPSTADIFSSNSGPFATGADSTRNQIIPQLAAAFNRSTLLESNATPTPVVDFYQNTITNHYARIVHAANVDGKGYAFPYDDVAPSDGTDQSGYVTDPNPQLLTVTVGGQQYG